MKLLLAAALALQAAPLPIGLPDAAKAAPPKREKRAAPAEKRDLEVPPAAFGGSGYDYFHLMAAPDMAGRPAVTTTAKPKKKPSEPELRDSVASPRPSK